MKVQRGAFEPGLRKSGLQCCQRFRGISAGISNTRRTGTGRGRLFQHVPNHRSALSPENLNKNLIKNQIRRANQ